MMCWALLTLLIAILVVLVARAILLILRIRSEFK